MLFAKILGGAVDLYPLTLDRIKKDNPHISFPANPDNTFLESLGYFTVQATVPPTSNVTTLVAEGAPVLNGTVWEQTWIITDRLTFMSPAEITELCNQLKVQRKNELADLRFIKETTSITVNGSLIRTDRDSQAKISGALAYVQLNPTALIDWKAEAGWVQLDAAQIQGIANAVGAHVQSCFTNEKTHSLAIDALGDVPATILAYDISTGWPV